MSDEWSAWVRSRLSESGVGLLDEDEVEGMGASVEGVSPSKSPNEGPSVASEGAVRGAAVEVATEGVSWYRVVCFVCATTQESRSVNVLKLQ